MRIGIMQPYLFPYIGYFQLMHAVDQFILLDDVQYINKGWINRNYWLVNQQKALFTMSLKKDSSRSLILNRCFSEQFEKDTNHFLETFRRNYHHCLNYTTMQSLIIDSLCSPHLLTTIHASLKCLNALLNIHTPLYQSSKLDPNTLLRGQDRIIHLVKILGGSHYINLPGGVNLYDSNRFEAENLQLSFIQPQFKPYSQISNKFIPWLSMIDVLTNVPPQDYTEYLKSYSLLYSDQKHA